MWLVVQQGRELQVVWIEGDDTDQKIVAGPFYNKASAIKAARQIEDWEHTRGMLWLYAAGIGALVLIQVWLA
jgi:hypothetical protein